MATKRLERLKVQTAAQQTRQPRLLQEDTGGFNVVDTGLPAPISLESKQAEAFRFGMTPQTDLNLEWGRGCGKSWTARLIAWCWVALADGMPRRELLQRLGVDLDRADPEGKAAGVRGVRIVFLMPTLKQFKDVHGQALQSEVLEWEHLSPKPNWTNYAIKFPGGSWIMPFPGELHSSKRALGIRCDLVFCDEADDTPLSVWESVVDPWFTEPWSLGIRCTGGTYKKGRHGLLYKRRLAGEDPEQPYAVSIHATYRDCPGIVSLDKVEQARRNTDPAIFEREWECSPDTAEGLVFGRVFDPEFHRREPPEDLAWNEILIGRDYGDEDPGVILVIGIIGHGRDAVAWVIDEVYERHRLPGWWKEQLTVRARYYGRGEKPKYYPDRSRPGDNLEEARMCGLRLQGVDNDIQQGLAAVANMLAIRERRDDMGEVVSRAARLYISPKCINLLVELGCHYPAAIADGQYRRKPDPEYPGKFLDDVVDKHNHGIDALRYAIFNRFGLPQKRR